MTPERAAELIRANADALHNNRITWQQFSARNRRVWRAVDMGELCIIGSDCDKRVTAVKRLLFPDLTL